MFIESPHFIVLGFCIHSTEHLSSLPAEESKQFSRVFLMSKPTGDVSMQRRRVSVTPPRTSDDGCRRSMSLWVTNRRDYRRQLEQTMDQKVVNQWVIRTEILSCFHATVVRLCGEFHASGMDGILLAS